MRHQTLDLNNIRLLILDGDEMLNMGFRRLDTILKDSSRTTNPYSATLPKPILKISINIEMLFKLKQLIRIAIPNIKQYIELRKKIKKIRMSDYRHI